MCRLRIPNGIMKHWQFAGLADLAERLCGPFCHVTTRANLQVREIPPKNAVALIEGIQDLGLCSRGSGADNIRNVTGTPTAGIDPQELLDTREYAREWHYHILNDRSLYGLPRKFNVAFDGAGKIAVLEDTNDIAFAAVEVKDGFGVEPGVWFRLGHRRHHRPQGFRQIRPTSSSSRRTRPRCRTPSSASSSISATAPTAQGAAEIRASTAWAWKNSSALVEERLGHALHPRAAGSAGAAAGVRPHGAYRRAQAEAGRAELDRRRRCRSARSPASRCAALPKIAQDLGDGDIRLTVWQNLLIPGVRDENVELAIAAIKKIGLAVEASQIRAGLIACTGNAGCQFAASDTKRHAAEIGDWCEPRVNIDTPLNIHSPAATIPARSITSAISA